MWNGPLSHRTALQSRGGDPDEQSHRPVGRDALHRNRRDPSRWLPGVVAGRATIESWFLDAGGEALLGAYYAYVERKDVGTARRS